MIRILLGFIIGALAIGAVATAQPSEVTQTEPIAVALLEEKRSHAVTRAGFHRYRKGWLKRGRTIRYQRRLHTLKWEQGVTHALKLAAVTFGVPYSQLVSVAYCESKLYPFAVNGQYRGIFQEGPMFEAGPYGRAGMSVWDVYANAMTAAYTASRQGWRQWACKP